GYLEIRNCEFGLEVTQDEIDDLDVTSSETGVDVEVVLEDPLEDDRRDELGGGHVGYPEGAIGLLSSGILQSSEDLLQPEDLFGHLRGHQVGVVVVGQSAEEVGVGEPSAAQDVDVERFAFD